MAAPLNLPVRRSVLVLAATVSWLVAGTRDASALPPVIVETHVVVRVRAIIVDGGKSSPVGPSQSAEAGPDAPGRLTLRVPWGPSGTFAEVRFQAALVSASDEGPAIVRCTARTTPPEGGEERVASREVTLGDEGSGIFEVFGQGGRRILLGLTGDKIDRAVVHRYPTVGAPVRFLVGVERVDGDASVLLETNELHTYVGQSVEYSFERGRDTARVSVRLAVLPVSITGDVITLDADVSGTLPGSSGPTVVSHHERIVASRRATSAVAATAGSPPAGYRFQVTPDF